MFDDLNGDGFDTDFENGLLFGFANDWLLPHLLELLPNAFDLLLNEFDVLPWKGLEDALFLKLSD